MAIEPTLRVGIDARLVAPGLGIAHYVRELTRELLDHPDIGEVTWFGARRSSAPPGVETVELRGWPFPFLDGPPGRAVASRAGIDVMHFTANTGWTRPAAVPRVVTVHDLIFLHESPRGGSLRQLVGRAYMRRNVPQSARSADRVVAVSAATAEDLSSAGWGLQRPPAVISHGVRVTAGADADPPEQPVFAVFGAADPRKNLALALDAFERAAQEIGPRTRLVVFGGAGLSSADQRRIIEAPSIELCPYLSREELLGRLTASVALLHPTLAEGFGFPVLDSMAHGVPVIGGLARVTREVAGEALVGVDGERPIESMAEAMVRLARDRDARSEVARRGRLRAAEFSWSRSAERHVEIYRAAFRAAAEPQ